MKQNISESDFINAFKDYNREDNFSYEGLKVLYNWIEEIDPNFELDVIGLCCDFSEFENVKDYLNDYPSDLDRNDYDDDDDFNQDLERELNNNSTLLKLGNDLNDGFIIHK